MDERFQDCFTGYKRMFTEKMLYNDSDAIHLTNIISLCAVNKSG